MIRAGLQADFGQHSSCLTRPMPLARAIYRGRRMHHILESHRPSFAPLEKAFPQPAGPRMIRYSLGVLLLVLAPLSAWGQSTDTTSSGVRRPSAFGSGEQPGLGYARESSPQSLLFVSLDTEGAYDTNALNTSKERIEDVTYTFGPRIALLQRRKHLNLGLDYQPYFLGYRKTNQLDQLNQTLSFDSSYIVSPRFAVRLRDSFRYLSYSTGIFEPRSSKEFVPVLGSPTSSNQTVLTPVARTQQNDARVDVLYQISRRSSLDLFGGFLNRKFTHRTTESQRLFNLDGANGGLVYSYRLSQASTLGALYSLENFSFGGQARLVSHSTFFSYALQLSPTITLSVYGGPQFSRLHDSFTFEIPFFIYRLRFTRRVVHAQWNPAFGGSFIRRSRKTVFEVSGQRWVTGGGGFFRASTDLVADLNVRRRLAGRWNVLLAAGYVQNNALSLGFFESKIRYASAGFGLERRLTVSLTGRIGYNYLRQRGSGLLPLLADVDRNRVSLGLFYQVRGIPMGR